MKMNEKNPKDWDLVEWGVFFQERLSELGGSSMLHDVLLPNAVSKEIRSAAKSLGGLKKLILKLGPQFKIVGESSMESLSLVKGRKAKKKKKSDVSSGTKLKETTIVTTNAYQRRIQGEIVDVDGGKIFIREENQSSSCPKQELFFMMPSRAVLRNYEDKSLLKLGAAVSFLPSNRPPNPNPYCSDVVVEDEPFLFLSEEDYKPFLSSSDLGGPNSSEVPDDVLVIEDVSSCQEACTILRTKNVFALDCEGVDLGRPAGSLCLVQIAVRDAAYLFDVQECPELFDAGLGELLEAVDIVKVVHDCRMDVAALLKHGVHLRSVFDTQITFGVLYPHAKSVSLKRLLQETSGAVHEEKEQAPHLTDRSFWQKRPFSPSALAYASADVKLLMDAATILSSRITSKEEAEKARRLSNARVMAVDGYQNVSVESSATPPDEQASSESLFAFWARANAAQTDQAMKKDCPLTIAHDLQSIVDVLPPLLAEELHLRLPNAEESLVDVVLDLRRPAVFIRNDGPSIRVDSFIVQQNDIETVLEACGRVTDANRACIGDSLHRCSVIYDPGSKDPVGLTVRMARVVYGIAGVLKDAVVDGCKSVLLIGPPGRGKTTLLRDIARLLSDAAADRRVMIVDTNNEIAGEAAVPHIAIGRARRMKVGDRSRQYRTMLEAVQNHTPETLIIDEIGMPQEVTEAIGIQQRGVQLIATTHGRTLADVIQNPHLRNLLGGVHAVILSAGEKQSERAASKTRMERKMPPAFDVCVELLDLHRWRVHQDVGAAVDAILRDLGEVVECEIRALNDGELKVTLEPFPDRDTVSQLNAFEIVVDN